MFSILELIISITIHQQLLDVSLRATHHASHGLADAFHWDHDTSLLGISPEPLLTPKLQLFN